MILADEERRFLAYAADEDERTVRWIETPVSGVELRAVCTGRLPLREAILKPSLIVADYTFDHRLLAVMSMAPEEIPVDCLPDPDALLPRFARDQASPMVTAEHAAFACDGPAVRGNAMPFAAISTLTSSLQTLWTSLGAKLGLGGEAIDGWGPATLPFAASHAGSFVIEVAPANVDSFAMIASEYKTLAHACYGSSDALAARLKAYDARIVSAYCKYLGALQAHRIDVMAEWATDAVFVGHACAGRVGSVVATAIKRDKEPRTTEFDALGFFDGWMSHKKQFEFYDVSTAEQYIGAIDAKLVKQMAERPPRLGRIGSPYSARIRLKFSDPSAPPTYRLLRLDAGPTQDSYSLTSPKSRRVAR